MRIRVLLFGVVVAVLSGCGSKATSTNSSTPTGASPTTTAPSPKPAASTLTVKESEPASHRYAYAGVGPVTGGVVTISFTNAGKKPHELQLARVGTGHTQADLVKTLKKLTASGNTSAAEPAWLSPAGGVGAIPPGATATSTLNLPAGQYYAVDTGGGGDDPGPKPFEQGAIAAFSVTGGSTTDSLPPTSAKIVTKGVGHDRFAIVPSGLKLGKNTVTLDNPSKQDHVIVAFPLLPGKTPADLKKVLASNGPPKGPPPADFKHIVGSSVFGRKTKYVTELNFAKPGQYVLVCFLTDRDGKGKPHLREGMFKPVQIK